MIKRIFKATLKGIIGISLIAGIFYGAFHLFEYSTGSKYIAYLKENSETIPLSEPFSFKTLDKDIKENRLILVGEIHGLEEPQKFDYELFTRLHTNHNVKQYYAELDYVQALTLNQYLESGDENLLKDALKRWAVVQGRNNKGYNDKYRKFHQYYQKLSEHEKFKFVGIDKLQDVKLTLNYLNTLNESIAVEIKETIDLDTILNQISQLDSIYSNSQDTLFNLMHIKNNLKHYVENTNREKVMFDNFYTLYKKLNDGSSKAYGYFGLYHVFQYQVNGNQPLASQIRMADLGLDNSILSMNFLMLDSYMVRKSNEVPEFM
jgi:hypothetical protein